MTLRLPGWLSQRLVIVGLLCIGTMVLLAPAALRVEEFSLYDESTHLDNAWRWSHFDIPQKGERISPEILSEWTCRGFHDPNVDFPDCTDPAEVGEARFPLSLSNYNTKHPPLYYIVNGFVARVLVAVTPVDSFVSGARIANGVWAAAVLLVAHGVFRRFGLARHSSVVLAILAVLIPVAFWSWTYVNNDVASYASAWVIGAAALRVHNAGLRSGVLGLVLAGVVGALTKGFTIGAVIAATIILLPTSWAEARSSGRARQSLQRLLAPGAASSVAVVGWLVIHRLLRSDTPYQVPFIRKPPVGIPWARISEQVIRVTAPIGRLPSWMMSEIGALDTAYLRWLGILAWLLSAAAGWLVIGLSDRHGESTAFRSLGAATLLSPPLLAAIIVGYNMGDGSPVFIPVIDRYHISVLPFFIISLGAVMASRPRWETPISAFVAAGLAAQLAIYALAV